MRVAKPLIAESEREKILEYANRHGQTRLEHGPPVGTGRAPYGWEWKDKEKTCYAINKEEAAVRVSTFEMFVELDMSIRGIAHKLTEDGILPPAKSRGVNVKSMAWQPSTVFDMLTDIANIGTLTIAKTTTVMLANGKTGRKPSDKAKTIPGGIPAIISIDTFQRAQLKLKNNQRSSLLLTHSNGICHCSRNFLSFSGEWFPAICSTRTQETISCIPLEKIPRATIHTR